MDKKRKESDGNRKVNNSKLYSYELQCDYCKRIIESEASTPIACTACGHGKLYPRKPKNYCDICGNPIYDNVSKPPVKVTCGDCVERRLGYFSRESRVLGDSVKKARQATGFSQRTFALAMECSQGLVKLIEQGVRQPTPKMREFMLQNSLSVSSRKKTTYEEGLK